MAEMTSCFALKAPAAQLDSIRFYTGPHRKDRKQRSTSDRELPDLEKLLAQYASGGASDVDPHRNENLVDVAGPIETSMRPSASTAGSTDAYSMFDQALSELHHLPGDGGALQARGYPRITGGAWPHSDQRHPWEGSRNSHYSSSQSELQELEPETVPWVSSQSFVGQTLPRTPCFTPEAFATASLQANEPQSIARGVGVTDPPLTPTSGTPLLQPLSQDTGVCQQPSPERRQAVAFLAGYDPDDVDVLMPVPTVGQSFSRPVEDSRQLENSCQTRIISDPLSSTTSFTGCVGGAGPSSSPPKSPAQAVSRCSSPTEIVTVAEHVSTPPTACSDWLDGLDPLHAETARSGSPQRSAMPAEIACSVISGGDDVVTPARKRLFRRRPTLKGQVERSGPQKKRLLPTDSDTDDLFEEDSVERAGSAADSLDHAGDRLDAQLSRASDFGSATPDCLSRQIWHIPRPTKRPRGRPRKDTAMVSPQNGLPPSATAVQVRADLLRPMLTCPRSVTRHQAKPGRSTPRPPDSPTWLVDRIVDSELRGKRGKLFYRVKWEDTWEPAESVQAGADAAVAEYFRLNPVALGQYDD